MLMVATPAFAAVTEGPRVPVETSGASVEHPLGWTHMPASGSPPMVMFTLCDPAVVDGCVVRGEMMLTAPNPGAESLSLKQVLEAAEAQQTDDVLPPRKLRSGRHDAVETLWQGDHSSHIKKQVRRAGMQIGTPAGLYQCLLTADPDLFESQLGQWRRFCASLELANHTPD